MRTKPYNFRVQSNGDWCVYIIDTERVVLSDVRFGMAEAVCHRLNGEDVAPFYTDAIRMADAIAAKERERKWVR